MKTQEINGLPWDSFMGSSICGVLLDQNAVGVWYGKQEDSGHDALFVLHKVDGKHRITGRIKNSLTGEKHRIVHEDPFARTDDQAIERVDLWMTTAPNVEKVHKFLMKNFTPEQFAKAFLEAGFVEARNIEVGLDGSAREL